MTAQRQTLIGLFFVVVTGILGWFTLFKSDLSLFAESFPMTAYFDAGGGLHEGDSVLVRLRKRAWSALIRSLWKGKMRRARARAPLASSHRPW